MKAEQLFIRIRKTFRREPADNLAMIKDLHNVPDLDSIVGLIIKSSLSCIALMRPQ